MPIPAFQWRYSPQFTKSLASPLIRRLFVAYGEGFFASSEGGLGSWDGCALSCWCVAAEMEEHRLRVASPPIWSHGARNDSDVILNPGTSAGGHRHLQRIKVQILAHRGKARYKDQNRSDDGDDQPFNVCATECLLLTADWHSRESPAPVSRIPETSSSGVARTQRQQRPPARTKSSSFEFGY
jgi:hypothetical protein